MPPPSRPHAGAGQYLQLVISASYDLLALDKIAIRDAVLAELAEIWPAARAAQLLTVVGRDRARGDVRGPAGRSRRCGPRSGRRSTACSWPATGPTPAGRPRWKGAVRSGYLAAQEILTDLDRPTRLIRPGLPSGMLARWLFGSAEYRPARPLSPPAIAPAVTQPVPPPCPVSSDER